MYKSTFAEQFSIAFDVYLDILHAVDSRVNAVLARNTENWRMLNACAPCMYKLDGEVPLPYGILAAMDGNSSLKLVDDRFRSGYARVDGRTCRTDLFLSPEEVDKFKDEVQNARKVRLHVHCPFQELPDHVDIETIAAISHRPSPQCAAPKPATSPAIGRRG